MPYVDISRNSNGHISVLRDATVTRLGTLVVLMYCICWCDLDPIQGQCQGHGAFELPKICIALHACWRRWPSAAFRGFLVHKWCYKISQLIGRHAWLNRQKSRWEDHSDSESSHAESRRLIVLTHDPSVQVTLQQVSNWHKTGTNYLLLYQQLTVTEHWKCKNESMITDFIRTRMLAINVLISNLAVSRLEQCRAPQLRI